jgi:hypothetical protein
VVVGLLSVAKRRKPTECCGDEPDFSGEFKGRVVFLGIMGYMKNIDNLESLAEFLSKHLNQIDRDDWFAFLSDLAIQGLKWDLLRNRSAAKRLASILSQLGARITFPLTAATRLKLCLILLKKTTDENGHLRHHRVEQIAV